MNTSKPIPTLMQYAWYCASCAIHLYTYNKIPIKAHDTRGVHIIQVSRRVWNAAPGALPGVPGWQGGGTQWPGGARQQQQASITPLPTTPHTLRPHTTHALTRTPTTAQPCPYILVASPVVQRGRLDDTSTRNNTLLRCTTTTSCCCCCRRCD